MCWFCCLIWFFCGVCVVVLFVDLRLGFWTYVSCLIELLVIVIVLGCAFSNWLFGLLWFVILVVLFYLWLWLCFVRLFVWLCCFNVVGCLFRLFLFVSLVLVVLFDVMITGLGWWSNDELDVVSMFMIFVLLIVLVDSTLCSAL